MDTGSKVLFSVMALLIVGAIGTVYYRYTITSNEGVEVKTSVDMSSSQNKPVEDKKATVDMTATKTAQTVVAEEEEETTVDSGLTAAEEEALADKEEGEFFGEVDMNSGEDEEDDEE